MLSTICVHGGCVTKLFRTVSRNGFSQNPRRNQKTRFLSYLAEARSRTNAGCSLVTIFVGLKPADGVLVCIVGWAPRARSPAEGSEGAHCGSKAVRRVVGLAWMNIVFRTIEEPRPTASWKALLTARQRIRSLKKSSAPGYPTKVPCYRMYWPHLMGQQSP